MPAISPHDSRGASAEPVPTSEGTAQENEANNTSPVCKVCPTTIDGGDEDRNTSEEYPRRRTKVVNPHTWPVCARNAIIGRGKRETTQNSAIRAGHQPAQVHTRGRWKNAVCADPAETDTAITCGVRLVGPLRSCSVAGSGK